MLKWSLKMKAHIALGEAKVGYDGLLDGKGFREKKNGGFRGSPDFITSYKIIQILFIDKDPI